MANLPKAPQWADYKNDNRAYTFAMRAVDSKANDDITFELPQDFAFVGVVTEKDEGVFRAVFMKGVTPFEIAQKEYNDAIDGYAKEAEASGAQITSLEELEAWLSGTSEASEPENVIDISELRKHLESN